MAQSSKTTTDHEEIKHWVEERGGKPATVKGTGDGGEPGLLRIDFPGYGGDELDPISWDDFFKNFDNKRLAFVYQDEMKSGKPSNFFKLVIKE